MTARNDQARPDSAGSAGSPGSAGSGALRAAVLTVRFASELAMLAALAIAGANASAPLAARIVLAVAGPVAAATVWGIGIGPRARRRWPDPWRLWVEIGLFLAAAAALAVEGAVVAAAVFAVLAIGIAAAVRLVAPGN